MITFLINFVNKIFKNFFNFFESYFFLFIFNKKTTINFLSKFSIYSSFYFYFLDACIYSSIESEIADVFIVLLSICDILNINLFKAFLDKEEENIKRVWAVNK